jgi:hypothetical protein
MTASLLLKFCSAGFAVLWIAGMLWFSQPLDAVNVVITTLCALAVGYGWYRAMRWQLPRGRIPSRR